MKELKAYPLIKSVSVVSFFTFISRCLGMIRDVLIFNFFGGTSLTVSAFFSGSETALFSLSNDDIEKLKNNNQSSKSLLKFFLKNPSGLLI